MCLCAFIIFILALAGWQAMKSSPLDSDEIQF